jgi:hypothetical protein
MTRLFGGRVFHVGLQAFLAGRGDFQKSRANPWGRRRRCTAQVGIIRHIPRLNRRMSNKECRILKGDRRATATKRRKNHQQRGEAVACICCLTGQGPTPGSDVFRGERLVNAYFEGTKDISRVRGRFRGYDGLPVRRPRSYEHNSMLIPRFDDALSYGMVLHHCASFAARNIRGS